MMKVLHINSADLIGGGERHLVELSSGLAARGHQVSVVLRPKSALYGLLASRQNIYLVPSPLRNALDFVSALQIARHVRKHRVDVIHAHLARDYPIAALAARLSGTPYVITRHLLFPLKPLQRFTLRGVHKVICVSRGVANVVRDTGLVPYEKIATVPNGTDFVSHKDIEMRHAGESLRQVLRLEGHLIVGTAGELSPHKGHEDFIRAAQQSMGDDKEIAFVIAGEDPSPGKMYRAYLESLICQLSLEKHVRLLGWVEDMVPFYRTLDVFVSAARTEPFGLVIVEAMASGAPAIIATATNGACEIIEDEETGIIVPIGDSDKLASAIQRLLVDVTLRKDMVSRAFAVVHERYSLDRMIEAVEKIYRETTKK